MELRCDYTIRDVNKLIAGLIVFELCLVLIFAADTLLDSPIGIIHRLFDLDAEGNIPAWFSSIQLFLIGLIFLIKGYRPDPDRAPSPLFFLMVGAGFVFLSADEAASIHEKITYVLKNFEWVPRFRGNHGIWIFFYPLIGLILLCATFREIVALCNRYRRATFIIATGIGIFLLGAVGLEIVRYQHIDQSATPLLYKVEVACEEFLEMFGASVMLYGAMLLPVQHLEERSK